MLLINSPCAVLSELGWILVAETSTPRSDKTGAHSSAKRRVSLAAGAARAFSTSLAVQLRRHSGEAFAASQLQRLRGYLQ